MRDVSLNKLVARVISNRRQVLEVAGLCQFVEIEDFKLRVRYSEPDKRRADESGASRYDNFHVVIVSPCGAPRDYQCQVVRIRRS